MHMQMTARILLTSLAPWVISPLASSCRVSFTLGIGATTGCVHRQDARPRLESSGILRQHRGRGGIETLHRTVPCVSKVPIMA